MQGELENDELVMMLVESALERPPAVRDSFLQSLCSDKPHLYQEVRSRIDWEELMGGFLREPLIVRDSPSGPFSAGDLISERFRVLRVLGKGGMGVVYEVLDEKLDRRIAIKCAQVGFQNRLPPEARSAREVSHYNVCKVHELHTARTPKGEVDFLTMEFIDGETLSQRISRSGPLNLLRAREIAMQLCAGLAQAHRQGVVHGDLKCSNVILARSTDGGVRAVLTDFGLAKLKSGDGTVFTSGERGGTLSYMAPELFLGEPLSAATDIYALGIIFHVMLTGRAPARVHTPESLGKPGAASTPDPDGTEAMTVTIPVVQEEDWRRKVADLPAPWRGIVDRCLAAEPTERFRSATEVTQALNPQRRTAKWIFAVLTIIPVAGFTVWQWQNDTGPVVRLAMLPPAVEGAQIQTANGILDDVASRLAGVRGNFVLISTGEVQRNKVDSPAKAKEVLGATHVMRTSLRNSELGITALASIGDISSGHTMRELKGTYAPVDISVLAKALTATVTGAFGLRGALAEEQVSTAAYPDYIEGVAELRRGVAHADKAVEYFTKSAGIDPKSALPHARIAEVYLQKLEAGHGHEWFERAVQAIAKAESLNPDSFLIVYLGASLKRQSGQYEEAAQKYRRAIELNPNNGDARRNLAVTYESMNQPDQAINTYKKAIEVQPGYYLPYVDFGYFYYSRGEYQRAEELFRRVTALVPAYSNGHSNLGATLAGEGRFKDAEESFRRALALDATPRNMSNLGALYHRQGRLSGALQLFEQSIAAGPPSPMRFANLGEVYRGLHRSRESAEAFRKALALAENDVTQNPRQAFSRSLLASIAAQLGDANRAQFEIAQALQMDAKNTGVLRQAVLTFETLKYRSKTIELLRDAPHSLLVELNSDAAFTALQGEKQFQELLAKRPNP